MWGQLSSTFTNDKRKPIPQIWGEMLTGVFFLIKKKVKLFILK